MNENKIVRFKDENIQKNIFFNRFLIVLLLSALSFSFTSCAAWKWTKDKLELSEKKEEVSLEEEQGQKEPVEETPVISEEIKKEELPVTFDDPTQEKIKEDSVIVEENVEQVKESKETIEGIIKESELREEKPGSSEFISETTDFSIGASPDTDIVQEETSEQKNYSSSYVNPSPKLHIINIKYGADKFVPGKITIHAGDTIKWVNTDTTIDAHIFQSVPASNPYDKEKDEIVLVYLYAEKNYSHTFEKIGVYPYFCFIHRGMRGEINVVKPGQSIEAMKKEVAYITKRKKKTKGGRLKLNAKEMVFVAEGKFIMGSPEVPMEGPVHLEFVSDFYIDKYEVTNEEYEEFVDSTDYVAEGKWRESYKEGLEKYPVVNVSYADAAAYAKWAGKRLPTEMEWEKAARGADRRIWPWGDEFDNEIPNIFGPDDYMGTSPVGAFEEDVSPSGVFDMSGNVSEWTTDPYLPYEGSEVPDHPDFSPDKKIIRGGSFSIVEEMQVATHSRKGSLPTRFFNSVGFRLVKDK